MRLEDNLIHFDYYPVVNLINGLFGLVDVWGITTASFWERRDSVLPFSLPLRHDELKSSYVSVNEIAVEKDKY